MATLDRKTEGGGPTNLAGPGARLRAKREGMGLSVEQVADQLRLDVKYIQALEQDNHADIAAPVFVRGYLRSYAALLQLPADAIVECYAAGDADTAALFEGPAQPKPKKRTTTLELRWLIGAGVVGLVIVAAVIFGERIYSLPGAAQMTPTVSPDANRPLTESGSASPQAGADQSASGATAKLVLRLSADSWVVISDGNGKEVVYDLMRTGNTRVLEGVQPPLQVVLGNSPAVTVEYNGVLFDQSRFNTNGVARFTLGADAR